MSLDGMSATMAIEAATDGDLFLAYLDKVLCPRLKHGQVPIMDNFSAHEVAGVRERIEQVGARPFTLPVLTRP